MTIQVLTNATASISALKADPMKVIASGKYCLACFLWFSAYLSGKRQ